VTRKAKATEAIQQSIDIGRWMALEPGTEASVKPSIKASIKATATKGRSKIALERLKVARGNLAAGTEVIDICDS
jgi:hypothetical protein